MKTREIARFMNECSKMNQNIYYSRVVEACNANLPNDIFSKGWSSEEKMASYYKA